MSSKWIHENLHNYKNKQLFKVLQKKVGGTIDQAVSHILMCSVHSFILIEKL